MVDLSKYDKNRYGQASFIKRFIWYYTNLIFFKSGFFPVSTFKIFLLKLFGAKVGKRVVMKPFVNIKYPWKLTVGDFVWIGEQVWIDNLVDVHIGNHVCISQGVLLITGNHDYQKISFDLIVSPIIIQDGAWICAHSIITAGVIVEKNAVLLTVSVASHSLMGNSIFRGNPAIKVRDRNLS